ncbi:MAG: hypothetical protein ACRC2T_07480 [Thermoguttaceae bacterium]
MLSRREFCKTMGVIAAGCGAYDVAYAQTMNSSAFPLSATIRAATLCKIPFGEWLNKVGNSGLLEQGYFVRNELKSFENKGITLVISKDEISSLRATTTLYKLISAEADRLGMPVFIESEITAKLVQCFSRSVSTLTGGWCNFKNEKTGELKGIAFGDTEHEADGYVISDDSLCTWTLYLRQPTGGRVWESCAAESSEHVCRELRLDIARLLDLSNKSLNIA